MDHLRKNSKILRAVRKPATQPAICCMFLAALMLKLSMIEGFCADSPQIIAANCFDGRNIGIAFDQPVRPVFATNINNYSVKAGNIDYAVASVRLGSDDTIVLARLSQEMFDASFALSVSNIAGVSGGVGDSGIIARVNNQRAIRLGHDGYDPVSAGNALNFQLGNYHFNFDFGALGGVMDDCLFVAEDWGADPLGYSGKLSVPETVDANAFCGLMIRETLDSASPFYAVLVFNGTPTNGFRSLLMQVLYRESLNSVAKYAPHSADFPSVLAATEINVILLRDKRTIRMLWSTNLAFSFRTGPSISFDGAFASSLFVGPVAGCQGNDCAPINLKVAAAGAQRADFPPQPQMSIHTATNQIILSWGQGSEWRYHVAQGSSVMQAKNWKPLPIWPMHIQDKFYVSVPNGEVDAYFVLRLSRF